MKILNALILCAVYAALNVSGAAIIKYNIAQVTLNKFKLWINFLFRFEIIVAFFLIFLSALVMFKALSLAKFSLVIPIANGINFSLTIVLGYFLFHDKLTLLHYVGISLILTGILMITFIEKA